MRVVKLGAGLAVPYPEPSTPAATAVGKGNRRTDTRPEVAVRSALHARGIRFRKDHPIPIPGRRAPKADIAFPRQRVAVFIDGCFWHLCPVHGRQPSSNQQYWGPKLRRNVERDHAVGEALRSAGWRVVRAWEHERPEEIAERVATVLTDPDEPELPEGRDLPAPT